MRVFGIAAVFIAFLTAVVVGSFAAQPARADNPDFRIITVEAEYGQLIIEVQHFRADGSHWFFEHYTFQGREAYKSPIDHAIGARTGIPHLDQDSILHTIRSIHDQRRITGWNKGRQRLTTTPLDGSDRDFAGAPLLAIIFQPMVGRSFIADGPERVVPFIGPLPPPADMAVGPEAGTVSVFFPEGDPDDQSGTSTDGVAWQYPDSGEFSIDADIDDMNHERVTNAIDEKVPTTARRQTSPGRQYDSYMRYSGVNIAGATVTTATIIINNVNDSGSPNTGLTGYDDDDAPAIVDDSGWNAQVLTTATVSDGEPDQWTAGTTQEIAEIATIVQEVIDRGAYADDHLGIFWTTPSSCCPNHKNGNSRETDGVGTRLHVEWTDASPGDDWAAVRDGTGSWANDYAETAPTAVVATTTTDKWKKIGRSSFLFDTSALPDTDVINSATFEFVATAKVDTLSPAQSISMVTSAPASDTALVAGDFDSLGTTKQATDLTLASLTADSAIFNTFTLSETGEGSISRTGVSKFGTRISGDFSDSEPTWSSGGEASVSMVTAEEDLSGDKRPKLTVTHGASGPAGGTTPLDGTRTSPAIDLSAVTDVAYCAIGWEATIPSVTTVKVSTSVNGLDGPFTDSTNGSCPAGITVGESLATITDFRTRVAFTTTDDTITPLMTALGLIVEDEAGQDVYYQLITTPSATLTDRSGSGNTGTMSYPVAPAAVTATTDPIVSTRTQLTFERALTVPAVVSAVTGSATADNLFGDETGFVGLPGFGIVTTISEAGDGVPIRFVWFIFLGLFIIGAGAGVLLLTNSMVMSAAAMAAAMGLAGAIGNGLLPLWIIFVFVPIAGVLILVRPGKLAS